ncbi:hypothetical protein ACFL6A_00230 [bacterium]
MVDINLFKDDGEEEKKWDSSPDKADGMEDDFKDDLNMGEDLGGSPSLDDDSLLGDIDAIPDLEESMESEQEEDYEIGDVTKKKTSPVLWIVLGVVLIGAFYYWFVYEPAQKKKLKTPNLVMRTNRPDMAGQPQDTTRSVQSNVTQEPPKTTPQTSQPTITPTTTVARVMGGELPVVVVPVATSVEATKAAFNDLVRSGQFAAVLIDGNRFMVEYVSETPGIAKSMGHRIQTLLNSTGYKTSPEEGHRTAGKKYYWGVVSGTLPQQTQLLSQISTKQYPSANSFIAEIRGASSRHKVVVQEVETMSTQMANNRKKSLIKMTLAGSRSNMFTLLDSLKGMQANLTLAKLLLVPSKYSDFNAESVKTVIDFVISVQ